MKYDLVEAPPSIPLSSNIITIWMAPYFFLISLDTDSDDQMMPPSKKLKSEINEND